MAFKIQRYGKSELAAIYQVSIKTFIKEIEPVMQKLEAVGYTKDCKFLTIKQVEIIVEFLGRPE